MPKNVTVVLWCCHFICLTAQNCLKKNKNKKSATPPSWDNLVQVILCESDYGITQQKETQWIINEQQHKTATLVAGSRVTIRLKQREQECTVFY